MSASKPLTQEKEKFRKEAGDRIRQLVRMAAPDVPQNFTDPRTRCRWQFEVNLGSGRDFRNIGRIDKRCVNELHTDHRYKAQHVSEPLPDEVFQQFVRLRAVYELAGGKYSTTAGVYASTEEKIEAMNVLYDRTESTVISAVEAITAAQAQPRLPPAPPASVRLPSRPFTFKTPTSRAAGSIRFEPVAESTPYAGPSSSRGSMTFDLLPSSSPPPSSPCPTLPQKRKLRDVGCSVGAPQPKKLKIVRETKHLGEIEIDDDEDDRVVVKEEKGKGKARADPEVIDLSQDD
ncbi:hypothetical protein V5O48_011163 [Marasmius crinis-equi]|uniref:Uncharacterized protein n=1 Tax=Marasmius crinis-equi TaxID=585013 RepID=A0ABR3F6B6_9AGAR